MIITTQDLILDALGKSGEKTDGTSEFQATALSYMDTFYKKLTAGANEFDVDLGDPFVWAKAKYPGVLVLEPFYDTGTVTMVAGSANGVFSAAPAASLAGYYLKVSNRAEYFRIVTHVAASVNFVIDAGYTDDSGTFAYQANPLDYNLAAANVVRLYGPMKVYRTQTSDGDGEGQIVGLDQRSFDKKWPMYRLHAGIPTEFAYIYNADGTITVRMNKIPATQVKVEYNYIPMPVDLADSAASIPIVPLVHRQVLSHATAYAILMDKQDDKSKHFMGLVQADLKALSNANRREFMQVAKQRGRLIPRGDDYARNNYPTSGGY